MVEAGIVLTSKTAPGHNRNFAAFYFNLATSFGIQNENRAKDRFHICYMLHIL
jgi:hypothetical protein